MISYFGYFTKSYKQNPWNLLLEIYEQKYYLIFSQDPEAALEAENKPNDEDWDDVIDDDRRVQVSPSTFRQTSSPTLQSSSPTRTFRPWSNEERQQQQQQQQQQVRWSVLWS